MSVLYPLGLLLGVVAPVVVALYLRRTKRVRAVVSSIQFWQRIADQHPRRRFLGALRNPLSLLLQLLALLLLLLALVRIEIGEPTTARQIVVIDGRARMQAHGGAVWADAVRDAKRVIARGGDGTETALILAGAVPRIVSPFSADRTALRAALDELTPTDGTGDLDEAVVLGERLRTASGTASCTVTVITDRTGEVRDATTLAVGRGGDNLAITSFAARRTPASPQTTEIFAEVGNFSASGRDAEVTFLIDGKTFDLKSLRIEPGARTGVSVFLDDEILRGTTARVEARLDGGDNLAIDDTAFLALSPEPPLRVLLVTEGNRFLEAALAADSRVEFEILTPDDFTAARGAGFDAVVFDRSSPVGWQSVGATAFFGGGPFTVGTIDTAGPLVVTNPASPLLRGLTLPDAVVQGGTAVEFPSGTRVDVAAEWAGHPALAAVTMSDGRRVVVVASDLEASAVPLRAGFPLLVSNTIHWLAGRSVDPRGARRAGEFLDVALDSAVMSPGGTMAKSGTVAALDRVGFHTITHPSGTETIGVSTASAAESDLGNSNPTPLPALARVVSPLPLWQWLAIAALVVILTEWILFHRRVTE